MLNTNMLVRWRHSKVLDIGNGQISLSKKEEEKRDGSVEYL